jgi:hypothetical protein
VNPATTPSDPTTRHVPVIPLRRAHPIVITNPTVHMKIGMDMTTANEVLKEIKDKDVKFVDLRFTDPKGKMQHVTMDVAPRR